uniref:Phosducin thioredoxin-like domain-containing protein n=1 Tax=Tetradesmus obliquus TaxID=3088 RepID=A0A383WQD4_TETOB|eukprot:jgi/Sobl393_1/19300/SZX79146.1
MADYHTVYKGPEGETTQWDDIQIRLGNMAPKPKPWKPDAYTPEQEEQKDKEWLDKKDEEEIAELDDEFQDDRALEEYRRKRIQELQAAAARPRFRSVEEISSNEFIEKVTNTSAKAWVNLPTLLLYHNRSVVKHLVGFAQFGGARATPEQVALVLNGYGPVCVSGDGDAAAEAAAAQEQVRGLLERMVSSVSGRRKMKAVTLMIDAAVAICLGWMAHQPVA